MRQTDSVILGLLSEAPLTGYQIKKLIDIRFRFFWSESYGQIFPSLRSLYERGLIEAMETQATKKRQQKTYRITEDGLNTLRTWLALPVERETVRLEILLKMYFSSLVDAEHMITHLETFRKAHEADLFILNLFEKELIPLADAEVNHPNILRVIDFGKKVNQAYLDWSRETIQFLKAR